MSKFKSPGISTKETASGYIILDYQVWHCVLLSESESPEPLFLIDKFSELKDAIKCLSDNKDKFCIILAHGTYY